MCHQHRRRYTKIPANGHPAEAWEYYQTTVRKSLEYPLAATTLTKRQCKNIEAPALQAGLQQSGMPSNLPRELVNGPKSMQGLGSPDLYFVQGEKHLQVLLDHGHDDSITGNHLRAGIEAHKLELGVGGSLFTKDFDIFRPYATGTWWTCTWEFLWDNKIRVEETTPNLLLQREGDSFLMETFIEAGYLGEDLAQLNRCRMYLQLATAADMASGDGTTILRRVLAHQRPDSPSSRRYNWPGQGPPSNQAWATWDEALARCFLTDSKRHRLAQPLGRWLTAEQSWPWMLDEDEGRIYELRPDGEGWNIYVCRSSRSRRSIGKNFARQGRSHQAPPSTAMDQIWIFWAFGSKARWDEAGRSLRLFVPPIGKSPLVNGL